MVLSNKKLKQKLRAQLAESLTKSESQVNQSDINASQTNQPVKSLLISATLKPKLSKREIRRVKVPSVQNGVEEKGSEEVSNGGLKIDKKRKREKDVENEVKDLSEKKNSKKNKKKKKKVVKKEKEGVQKANGGNEEQAVAEAIKTQTQIQIQTQNQTSKEDESISTKIYVGGIPYYSTVDDIQSFFQDCGTITEIDCLKFPETGKFNGIAMISFRTEAAAKRALALDGSDMGGLSLKVQPYKATRHKKVSDFAPAMLEGYNRIYVGNLSWEITEKELNNFFSDCSISSIRLGKDKETGEFRGFAHVDFSDSLSLTMALKLDQNLLFGRPVRIRCAVPPISVNKKDADVAYEGIKTDDVADNVGDGKVKGRTCYECGEKGHLSLMCPNKKNADVAYKGIKNDDVADNVADGKVKGRTCYECGEKGHLSLMCPNKKNADVAYEGIKNDDVADDVFDGKVKGRTCYECGEKGHLSSMCPNKKAADVAYKGFETDDVAFDNVGDSKLKRRTCYECGEKGHLSSSCTKKQAADVANLVRVADDVAVDYKTVNSVSDGKLRRRTCYECGERGHLSSECPKKQTADVANTIKKADIIEVKKADVAIDVVSEGKLRRRTCYECGERGHLSSLCPKKQAADVAISNKESDDMEVEEVKTMEVGDDVAGSVISSKLRRRTCYECGLKGHLSSLCPNKQETGLTA